MRPLNISNAGKCPDAETYCQVPQSLMSNLNTTEDDEAEELFDDHCCWGFCVDLLKKLREDLNFTYVMVRAKDGRWGTAVNGTWNGLVGALLNGKTDMVLTSLSINSMRAKVVDFTVPFLETGTGVVAAKRTRPKILTPEAFFQYFDTLTWVMILGLSLHLTATIIILFEWMSPSVYNMTMKRPKDYKFSPLRAYWLVWADILNASVTVVVPKSMSARLMTCVWAMIALVFLAIYQAKCTTLMLSEEEYLSLGSQAKRLTLPNPAQSILRYGTVPNGHTDYILKKKNPGFHRHIGQFNRSSVHEGIEALKTGELDGFIYDATVLDYLVSKDPGCSIQTIGSKMSVTGYGIGFPKNSKYFDMFNEQIIAYTKNGDLDRLRQIWMSGKCHVPNDEGPRLLPLSLKQYGNAFVLLVLGIVLSGLVLLLEHVVHACLRKRTGRVRWRKKVQAGEARFMDAKFRRASF